MCVCVTLFLYAMHPNESLNWLAMQASNTQKTGLYSPIEMKLMEKLHTHTHTQLIHMKRKIATKTINLYEMIFFLRPLWTAFFLYSTLRRMDFFHSRLCFIFLCAICSLFATSDCFMHWKSTSLSIPSICLVLDAPARACWDRFVVIEWIVRTIWCEEIDEKRRFFRRVYLSVSGHLYNSMSTNNNKTRITTEKPSVMPSIDLLR